MASSIRRSRQGRFVEDLELVNTFAIIGRDIIIFRDSYSLLRKIKCVSRALLKRRNVYMLDLSELAICGRITTLSLFNNLERILNSSSNILRLAETSFPV